VRKTVCVDLDGVLAYHETWQGVDHFGEPLPGAVQFTHDLAEFADVVIHTCRCNPECCRGEAPHFLVRRVQAWLDQHGFTYHHIYAGLGKPLAAAYIDDRAVECRPQHEPFAKQNALNLARFLCREATQQEQATPTNYLAVAQRDRELELEQGIVELERLLVKKHKLRQQDEKWYVFREDGACVEADELVNLIRKLGAA